MIYVVIYNFTAPRLKFRCTREVSRWLVFTQYLGYITLKVTFSESCLVTSVGDWKFNRTFIAQTIMFQHFVNEDLKINQDIQLISFYPGFHYGWNFYTLSKNYEDFFRLKRLKYDQVDLNMIIKGTWKKMYVFKLYSCTHLDSINAS